MCVVIEGFGALQMHLLNHLLLLLFNRIGDGSKGSP